MYTGGGGGHKLYFQTSRSHTFKTGWYREKASAAVSELGRYKQAQWNCDLSFRRRDRAALEGPQQSWECLTQRSPVPENLAAPQRGQPAGNPSLTLTAQHIFLIPSKALKRGVSPLRHLNALGREALGRVSRWHRGC